MRGGDDDADNYKVCDEPDTQCPPGIKDMLEITCEEDLDEADKAKCFKLKQNARDIVQMHYVGKASGTKEAKCTAAKEMMSLLHKKQQEECKHIERGSKKNTCNNKFNQRWPVDGMREAREDSCE